MFKQLSGLVLALSVVGLTGCGTMPFAPQNAPESPVALAVVGQHGATVTLDFHQGFAAQAVHRWVPADIVRYDVVLMDVTAGLPGIEVLTKDVAKDKTGVKFSGLSFGKKYHAYVQIKGNEGGVATNPLLTLNQSTQSQAGIGHVVYDFTALQNIDDNQSGTVELEFDTVTFDGKGGLTIVGPADGQYVNDPAGPQVVVE